MSKLLKLGTQCW